MSKKIICPHCGSKKVEDHNGYYVCEACKNSFGREAVSDKGIPMVEAVKGLRFRYGDVVSGSVRLRIVEEKDGSCLFEVYDANGGGVDKVADVLSQEEWKTLKEDLFHSLYLADWDREFIPNNDGKSILDNNEWELGIDVNSDEVYEYVGYDAYPVYWKDLMKLIEPFFDRLEK